MNIECAGGFAARVHAEHRRANVHRADAELRGDDRADGRTARQVAADDELLRRVTRLAAQRAHVGGGRTGGRVGLVRVVLDHEAAVEARCVLRIVAIGEVRVERMGHVRADEERTCDRPRPRFHLRVGVPVRDAGEHVTEEASAGADRAAAAALFVIVENCADGRVDGVAYRRQRLRCGIRAREVVESRAEDELLIHAAERPALRVIENEIVSEDGARSNAEGFSHQRLDVDARAVIGLESDRWRQVALFVQL